MAIFYKSYTKDVEAPDTCERTDEARRVLKAYPVFNADQVEGLPERFHPAAMLELVEPAGREAELDAFFAAIPVNLRHQGCEAYYEPTADRVTMPSVSRSEEHPSELQSLMRISYAVFCLKKKIRLQL